MSSAGMGDALDMESSQEELLEASRPPNLRTKHRHTVAAVAGLLMVCAAVAFWRYPGSPARTETDSFVGLFKEDNETNETREVNEVSEVDEVNEVSDANEGHNEVLLGECSDFPFLKITEVISSNLGKQGPDKDAEEGIIYRVSPNNTGDDNITNLELHFHSVTSFDVASDDYESYNTVYRPAFTHGSFVNGVHGNFAAINLKPNETVKLRVHAFDADKNESVPLHRGVVSFFDFDTGPSCVEHLKITDYTRYYLTNETQINVTTEGDLTVFTATEEGTGDDNPEDPTSLTLLQKHKAVTIEFEDLERFQFEIGTSPGHTGRVFEFVFRPSLLCAKTLLPDGAIIAANNPKAPFVVVPSDASKGLPSAFLMLACLAMIMRF